jgi:ADP-ribose pyrophosphatase YjhB (NUDIX family)
MEIKSQLEHKGKIYNFTYHDGVPAVETDPSMMDGVHSFCFYNDKLVIVGHGNDEWTPPGGSIEKGETYEEASIREVREESNMKVLYQECIGYQDIETSGENRVQRQFRMFAIVEPYGDFESDPDGDIIKIKLIDPKDYKEYIKWGEIGDHLMTRALESLPILNNE